MAEKEVATTQPSTVKGFMAMPSTIKRVNDLLGDRSSQFMTSVSSMIGADDKLAKCEPVSLFMACLTAAALDLPINKNLGFAHIIPYDNNRAGVTEAQFQMGWKGYVQLAQRTGQYKSIAATAVYEGQLETEDPLSGNTYNWNNQQSDKVIGYVAKFTLVTGFEHELYMSAEQMEAHAKKFSKAYQYDLKPTTKYKNSPWSTGFEGMALKTVIKLLISKWGPMSVDLQQAVQMDSAVIKDNDKVSYIDGNGDLDDTKADVDEKRAIIEANVSKDEKAKNVKSVDEVFNDTKKTKKDDNNT